MTRASASLVLAILVAVFAGALQAGPVAATDPDDAPGASIPADPSAPPGSDPAELPSSPVDSGAPASDPPSAPPDPVDSASPSASPSPSAPIESASPSPTPSPSIAPTPTPIPTPTPTPAVPALSTTGSPPTCRITDVLTKYRAYTQYQRTLVDWIYRTTSTYVPHDLTAASRAGLSGGGSVRSLVIIDLRAMTAAAKRAGAPIAAESAYRSYRTQVATFASWVRRLGYSTAIVGSARPGHSEHQLGTVIDFKSAGGSAPWAINGYDWARSKAGAWMKANAWKYGFMMSYPSGRKSQVCYGYEPWHYRYYGRAIAAAMHASSLTPRYWLWRHGSNQ
jgi:D-alanyl-D-alanine carboxypeptidase